MVVRHWPRPDDQSPPLSRASPFTPGLPVHCQVLLSGTVMEAYADDQAVLSTRLKAAEALPCTLDVKQGAVVSRRWHRGGPPSIPSRPKPRGHHGAGRGLFSVEADREGIPTTNRPGS